MVAPSPTRLEPGRDFVCICMSLPRAIKACAFGRWMPALAALLLVSCSDPSSSPQAQKAAAPAETAHPAKHADAHGSTPNREEGSDEQTVYRQSEGTKEMAKLLQEIANGMKPARNGFFSDINVADIRSRLAVVTEERERLELMVRFPMELTRAGLTEEAIRAWDHLDSYLAERRPDLLKQGRRQFLAGKAVSWLRLGEQDNCLQQHTTESCLLPIREAGRHKITRGSKTAISILETSLREFPDDLTSRWLLNIAHMTLGDYPDLVPPEWVIPPQAFQSTDKLNRFTDVAAHVGVDVFTLSGGSVLEDFDNDGYLDLMVSSIGLRDQLRYFRNQADGTFKDLTMPAGLKGLVGGLNMVQADYNNDGWADVFVLRGAWFGPAGHHPNSLLKNNGNGTFSDVTKDARILSFHPTQTAVWWDYNNDGWLDIYVGNETTGAERNACELYRNNRDGTFTECAAECGVQQFGFVKAVASADYNNDGLPDLYLSQLGAPNVLFRNDGPVQTGRGPESPWRFTQVADAGVEKPINSFPCWFFDYDNDGWEDLFVSSYQADGPGDVAAYYFGMPYRVETSRLYHNDGQGRFRDVSESARMNRVFLAMGSNYGDLDSDGWLDAYLGTGDPSLGMLIPNVAMRNDAGRRFLDVTTVTGLGHLQKGHGISFGDIDLDGDQDVHADMGGAFTGDTYPNALFENPGHGNHWVTLKLEGTKSNRAGVGARIKVVTQDSGGSRVICRTVRSGGSFGASPLRQEIGLGQAKTIERVEIRWPASPAVQVLRGLELDHVYRVNEGAASATLWPLKAFKLAGPGSAGAHHHFPGRQ